MSVKVQCPECGRSSTVREAHIGRTIRCTQCQGTFRADSSDDGPPPAATESATESSSPPPSKTGRASATSPVISDEKKRPSAEKPKNIGRFEVRARLGAGAFGTVYRAYDPQLDREIALKVPQAGSVESPRQVERFLREARAAARLRHPHIVPVYDAGRDEPHYFIASAFIKGRTLSRAVDSGDIDFTQAAQTVRELAEALAYAHGLGIVHRDVKSSNVMLDEQDQAHLMDFGLAYDTSTPWWSGAKTELEEGTPAPAAELSKDLTHIGAVVGTPAYMAPEQAKGKSGEALPASDQYSLGVILYELLCGELPFSGPVQVVLFNVIHQEAPPPHTHREGVPKDLETICQKAMAKRPADRYADCQELADDLRRWLDGEPIKARPLGPVERLVRWCRREPKLAVAVAVAALSLLAVAAVFAVSAARTAEAAEKERTAKEEAVGNYTKLVAAQEGEKAALDAREQAAKKANESAKKAEEAAIKEQAAAKKAELETGQKLQAYQAIRHLVYDDRVKLVAQDWDNARLLEARSRLETLRPKPQESDLRGWEWYYLRRLATRPAKLELKHADAVNAVAFSHDGKRIASAGDDGVKIWDADSGALVYTTEPQKGQALAVAFSNSGLLASAWADGTVQVYEVRDGVKPLFPFMAHKSAVTCLAFHPDPKLKQLATGSRDKTVKYWDVSQGKAVDLRLPAATHNEPVASVAFSPDAKFLCSAALGGAGDIKAWYFPLWEKWQKFVLTPQMVALSGAPNAAEAKKRIAINICSWPSGDFEPFPATSGHNLGVTSLAWHPDSLEVALGSPDQSVSILRFKLKEHNTPLLGKVELPTEPQIFFLGAGHHSAVNGVAYSHGSEDRFASASSDRTVRVWDRKTCVPLFSFKGHLGEVRGVAINPDGTRLASASRDGLVKVWDLTTNQEALLLRAPDLPVQAVAFSPDNRFLALGAGWPSRLGGKPANQPDKGEVRVWDRDGKELPLFKGHTQGVTGVAFGKDGSRTLLASASHDKTVRVWDVDSRTELPALPHDTAVYAVAFRSDGKRLATGTEAGLVLLWNLADPKKPVRAISAHQNRVHALTFSPDGRTLVSAGEDGLIRFWDQETGQNTRPDLKQTEAVYGLSFDQDGKRLASASKDQTARIWSMEPGNVLPLLILKGHSDWVMGVAFSPDGKRLASVSMDKSVHLWDTATGQDVLALTELSTAAMGVAFSPDGQRLAVADLGATQGGAAIVFEAPRE